MLVLTRRLEESIVIQDDIVVTVLAIEGDKVKLGISAPRHLTILRQELCEAVREQNLAAARHAELDRAGGLEAVRRLLLPEAGAKHE
ncbi:MAG: carbon storage regulator CsrA [Chloroflexi bacterium]|nr:carbon storage regulator CsrA [Chloroflexota bacterium]